MSLNIHTFVNGKWRQNCYIVNNDNKEALIIDPGSGAGDIIDLLGKDGLRPLAIFNTHAHYDHIGAVAELADHYAIPFYLHSDDMDLLKRANMYKMIFESTDSIRQPATVSDLLEQNKEIRIGQFSFSWLTTPGHTEGGVCFLFPDHIFTGDTLLKSGGGRTDLPGGNGEALQTSLEKLAILPGDMTIHAGHGTPCLLSEALGRTSVRLDSRP